MISICIPTYNCNVEPLIENLLNQVERCDEKIEIIVIDDASNEKYLIKNAKIIEKIKYIVLPQNIGRAKIRNRFLDYASYNYLLFLDSDTMPVSDKFIFNYIDTLLELCKSNQKRGGK